MVRIRVRVGPKGQEELVSEEEYHGKLLVRVGPKGEVIIPRALGEATGSWREVTCSSSRRSGGSCSEESRTRRRL